MADLFWGIVASPEFAALLLTAIAAVAGFAARWVRREWLKRVDDKDRARIEELARKAVVYVEQVYKDVTGEDIAVLRGQKADAARAKLAEWLKASHISLTPEQIIVEIEVAVATALEHK